MFCFQVLVNIAQEIAKEGGKPGTPKINGRYIHSHLAYRLEGDSISSPQFIFKSNHT
jgi:hypothetical protein